MVARVGPRLLPAALEVAPRASPRTPFPVSVRMSLPLGGGAAAAALRLTETSMGAFGHAGPAPRLGGLKIGALSQAPRRDARRA